MTELYTDYDPFAEVYDRYWSWSADRFLFVVEGFLLERIEPGARILDLACGSGRLAAKLIEKGYAVVGVDGSEAMIRLARRNAPEGEFHVADVRSFALDERCAAALSTFDSLNHLMSIDDLERTFRQVHQALEPGGWFLFDLNMREGYERRWRGSFGIADQDCVLVARSFWQPEESLGRTELTILRPEGESWRRQDVSLSQRCYPPEEVTSALASAGFEEVESFESETDLSLDEAGRRFFLTHSRR